MSSSGGIADTYYIAYKVIAYGQAGICLLCLIILIIKMLYPECIDYCSRRKECCPCCCSSGKKGYAYDLVETEEPFPVSDPVYGQVYSDRVGSGAVMDKEIFSRVEKKYKHIR